MDQELTHELQALVEQGTLQTLDDLNTYWDAWLEQSYHQQVHRSLGITPQAAWDRSRSEHGPARIRSVAEVQRIFLWQERRKVDKTGVIHLAGNRYEVETILSGKWVECRYDPFAMDQIHITYRGQEFADAVPLVLHHHRHREAPVSDRPPAAPKTGINLASLARVRQEATVAARRERVRYAHPPASPDEEQPS